MSADSAGRDVRAVIRGAEIFRSLGDKEADLIAANSMVLEFRKGIPIFDEGRPGDCLFIVISGSVVVEKRMPDGGRHVVAELIPGDCFGELELLTNGRRSAAASTAADSVLLRFPQPGVALDAITQGHPEVAAPVLRSMLSVISGRTRSANAMLKENSTVVQELKRQVYGDKLSGLHNRTWLEETMAELCKSGSPPLALLMLKPDNFKSINDSYGHEAGDRTIMLMAAELRKWADASEDRIPFRFAGNELGLVLKGMSRDEAMEAAESIKRKLSRMDLAPVIPSGTKAEPDLRLSISVGIGTFPEHGVSGIDLVGIVNELPLKARNLGGDRIVFPEDVA